MRYLDSGTREPEHALGRWLEHTLTDEVVGFRCQTGFFSANGLGPFVPTFKALAQSDRLTHVLIGSNDGETQTSHVIALAELMGVPRPNARLGVVCFQGAFFHPKTYHIARADGSQAAYVGSANLGLPGLGALHVEAGLTLDTREGDPGDLLNEIATAVDAWFEQKRAGLEVIQEWEQVKTLELSGVLAAAPPLRSVSAPGGSAADTNKRPVLTSLIKLTPYLPTGQKAPAEVPASAVQEEGHAFPECVNEPGFPDYVLFAPGRPSTTHGLDALTGKSLPEGTAGLIIRVGKDAGRIFLPDGVGTANVGIPIQTMSTLRFGFLRRKTERPRAEFEIDMRYMDDAGIISAAQSDTNVMVYGFLGDTGNPDRRLPMRAEQARDLREKLLATGRPVPGEGDIATLEWPTLARPSFIVTFLGAGSAVADKAEEVFATAQAQRKGVSRTAAWLPVNFF